jgi:protein-tyrosine-phosphatase
MAAACTQALVDKQAHGIRWTIDSAGTETTEGGLVRTEATRAASIVDVDISEHAPVRLSSELCDDPDLILAMSWEQVSYIWSLVPGAWDKVFTMKEFIHWAKRAPIRPPILFADRAEEMRDKVIQAHAVRKRARADYGFWGGIRPQDLNLIEPNGKGDEAWNALANAVHALASDVITLLTGPTQTPPVARKKPAARSARRRPTRAKAKAARR